MTITSKKPLKPKLLTTLWAMLFVTLPVTSFPFFPSGLGGKTLVRPLALYPLILLTVLVTLPRLFKKPLPKTFIPLLAFIVTALISSLVAFSSDLESLRGVTFSERFVRNVVTLGIGFTFYLTVSLYAETWDEMHFSLRWLYIGFSLALLWGTLQAVYVVHYSPAYFKLINKAQALISTRKLFVTRISGLTYEPKWFAEQICFLLCPWLLGAVLTKRSIFRWRFKRVTVEWILLVWSAGVLAFTYSRTGLFTLATLVLVSYLIFRFQRKVGVNGATLPLNKRRIVLEIIVIVLGMLVALLIVGSQNNYFSRFWRYFTEARQRNRSYFEYIAVEQRFVYWQTAMNMFDSYPILGVGLGNYAFYFDEMLPNRLYHMPEILRQTTPVEGRDSLITPKNLTARLLAETGLLGTSTFITFIFAIAGCVLYLWFHRGADERYWAISGLLGMVVFSLIAFSSDSFALPNMWIVFGFITAAVRITEPPPGNVQDSPTRLTAT